MLIVVIFMVLMVSIVLMVLVVLVIVVVLDDGTVLSGAVEDPDESSATRTVSVTGSGAGLPGSGIPSCSQISRKASSAACCTVVIVPDCSSRPVPYLPAHRPPSGPRPAFRGLGGVLWRDRRGDDEVVDTRSCVRGGEPRQKQGSHQVSGTRIVPATTESDTVRRTPEAGCLESLLSDLHEDAFAGAFLGGYHHQIRVGRREPWLDLRSRRVRGRAMGAVEDHGFREVRHLLLHRPSAVTTWVEDCGRYLRARAGTHAGVGVGQLAMPLLSRSKERLPGIVQRRAK